MPLQSLEVPNPQLAASAYDFRSVTEYRELPVRYECLEDSDGGGEAGTYGTATDFYCQEGCGEKPFQYILEEGDIIPFFFRAPDTVNSDPASPDYGWKEDGGAYLVGLQVLSMSGAVLFDGVVGDIATRWSNGMDGRGPWQAIEVSLDKMEESIEDLPDCFFFRVKVSLGLAPFSAANGEAAYEGTPPIGWRYINFVGGDVQEWNGSAYVTIRPDNGEAWYVADSQTWYRWNGTTWVGLAEAPAPAPGDEFDYLTTMTYRKARCSERVVHFRAVDSGMDCLGVNHDPLPPQFVMDAIDGLSFVFTAANGDMPSSVPRGVLWLEPALPTLARRTIDSDSPWEWVSPTPEAGARALLMNAAQVYIVGVLTDVPAGTVFELQSAYVPFTGYWTVLGTFADLYPDDEFTNEMTVPWVVQHDFKVIGSLEVDQLPVTRELTTNNRLVRRTSISRARVRTTGVPEIVARRIQAVLASKRFYINEKEWTESDGLRKNNEEGTHWWPDFVVGSEECSGDTSCE